MSDDNTVNSNKKNDGENNGQGTRNVRDGQRHGDDDINLELNHDSMELYLERQQKWWQMPSQSNSTVFFT